MKNLFLLCLLIPGCDWLKEQPPAPPPPMVFEDAVEEMRTERVYHDSIPVVYISNHDGDTITVDIPGWPAVVGDKITVRILGIDTPEMDDGRSRTHILACQARDLVSDHLKKADRVELQSIRRDKYFRLCADVVYYPTAKSRGTKLSEVLLEAKLAKPYDGGAKTPW